MGWLIDLAKAAIPEPMPGTGARPQPSALDRLLSLPAKADAHLQKALAMTDLPISEAFEERAGILVYAAGLPRAGRTGDHADHGDPRGRPVRASHTRTVLSRLPEITHRLAVHLAQRHRARVAGQGLAEGPAGARRNLLFPLVTPLPAHQSATNRPL